jgi:tetratricopeptide (TPR) repeat protein
MKLRFPPFELDTAAFELRRLDERVHLERRPMEALIYLIGRRGELVTREELIQRLWGSGVVIEFDTAVHTLVRKIRQALQDSADAPAYLETVARKGYRFIAPVEELGPAEPVAAPAAPVAPRRKWWHWPAVATGIVATLAIGAWTLRGTATHEPPRIAVLAFETLGPDQAHEYLGHGLAEDTSAMLAQLDPSRLEVVGPMSTLAALNTHKSLDALRRELDFDYAVQGTLRIEGSSVRVTANLLRGGDLSPVWTATFDRELTSVLGLQRELSAAIARQVEIRVSAERESQLAKRQTGNPQAYDLYLRGRHAWRQLNPVGNREASRYYEMALQIDPSYALAWAGLAVTFTAAPMNSDADPALVRDRARAAAERAVQLAPELPEAQYARGYVDFWIDGHWPSSLSHLRRSMELDPSNAMATMLAGHVLSQSGEQVEARALLQRARELDPLLPMTYAMSSQVAFQARDYEAAREFARQAIAIDPQFWIGYMQLGQVLERTGEFEAAVTTLDKSVRLSGGNSKPAALRAYTLARMGRADEARAVLDELGRKAQEKYVPPYAFALIQAGLGNEAAAREWLERALAAHDPHLAFLTVDPKWDVWRQREWFASLLKRCAFY